MVGDAVAKRGDGAVVAALAELRPSVRLVRHPSRALEGGPFVPVADVEEVEDAPHEILPAVLVEGRRIAPAVRIEPLRRLSRQVHVHRLRDRREEEVRGRRVMVHEHLRMPAQNPIHHGAHFRLALRHEIAVHVEAEMAVAPRDAPRLVLLERPGVIGPDAD